MWLLGTITAEAEQHLEGGRSGPALVPKVLLHALASLHPASQQPRACRDVSAGQKAELSQGWLGIGRVSLAQETLWPQKGRAC